MPPRIHNTTRHPSVFKRNLCAFVFRWLVLTMLASASGLALHGQPRIRALSRQEDGRVHLDILPSGEEGEVLDVFVSDSLTEPNWRLAAPYLFPDDSGAMLWIEPEPPSAPTRARFFQLGRADIDLNENGIPDAREALYHIHDLPADTRARWARAGIPSGIPVMSGPVLNVMDFGAKGDGQTDDTAAIRQAIAEVPTGGVVYLQAGVYRITQPLYLKPDMVLRGAGSSLTSLMFEGSGTAGRCIGILRWDSQQPTSYVSVTDGMQQGSTEVGVSSVSGFQPGDIIEIEEDNDPGWGLNDAWQLRLPGQINRIVAIDAAQSRLTLDRHLRHAFSAERNPRLRKLNTIANVGIENLFVQRKDAVNGYTIEMKYAVNVWIRNVESYMTYKAHVWMDRSFECEIRESYFHESHVFGGGGQGYGVGCGRHTSDCLIENNVFRHLRHSMIVGVGANGNVYGYNFSTMRGICPVHGTPQADISVHGNYVFMNLFEGNVLEGADVPDWFWPAGPGNTLFRNRIVDDNQAVMVGSDRQNLAGNVMPYGTLVKEVDLQGVVDYGNVRRGDFEAVSWPGCDCRTLPDSVYRSVPPLFMRGDGDFAWPPIGPDVEDAGPAVIPAGARFLDGAYVP